MVVAPGVVNVLTFWTLDNYIMKDSRPEAGKKALPHTGPPAEVYRRHESCEAQQEPSTSFVGSAEDECEATSNSHSCSEIPEGEGEVAVEGDSYEYGLHVEEDEDFGTAGLLPGSRGVDGFPVRYVPTPEAYPHVPNLKHSVSSSSSSSCGIGRRKHDRRGR